MIAQRTDGCSQESTNQGVMNGLSYKTFIPFYFSMVNQSLDFKNLYLIYWPIQDPCYPKII